MLICKSPIFSSLPGPCVAAALGDWLWVHLSLQNMATLVLLPLLGTMAKKQTDLRASAQCAPCVQSQRALKQTRQGPGEQVPALPCPPMASCRTPTRRDRDTSTEQGRGCACQLRWGPQAGPWPLTVSEKGDQVSLAMTVKLKGHASERWGWLLCDLLGTSPYE